MVSSKNIEQLREVFKKHQAMELPDIYSLPNELSNVMFEVYTIDSYLAGLASKVLEYKVSLQQSDGIVVHKQFLKGNKIFVFISESQNEQIDISCNFKVQNYIKGLEKLRLSLLNFCV